MITFIPWVLRDCAITHDVWNALVENYEKSSLSELRKVKQILNNPPISGLILVENKSPAMKRLGPGWKELEYGVWYKIFT